MADQKGTIVMIESPYSGDIDRNVRYLLLCMTDAGLLHNELPYASHCYMTQHPRCKNFYVSDYDKKWDVWTRETAIESSQRMRHRCDKTVFYTDRGWSRGMQAAKAYCQSHGLPFEERRLHTEALAERVPFLSTTFTNAIISADQDYSRMLKN